ncbi:MAG: ice-binding family protein [Gallionellaceae bacterium]|jgi:hypothetical protein
MKRFELITKPLLFLMAFFVAIATGCSHGGGDAILGGGGAGVFAGKEITSFSINGVAGVINETTKTISVTLPHYSSGTTVTNLATAKTATFTSTGANVKVGATLQESGTTANVFNPSVAYVVTASDGLTASYTVNVTVATITDSAITSYSLNGIAGVISEATTPKTITVVMPFGTDVTLPMTATYLTTGLSVKVAGTTQNSALPPTNVFTPGTPKVYVVHAADGITIASYNVNVTVASNTAKDITSYSIDGVAGVINDTTGVISVILPYGTDLSQPKISTFRTTGVSVAVAGVAQSSGVTTNVFTLGVSKLYTVTAADSSLENYNVNVSVATSTARAITSYSLNGIAGIISEATTPKTISVVMPFGTNLATAMTATYLTTGTSVTVGGVVQNSALPPTNVFTSGTPKVYIVHAADGTSTASYNVNVTVATSSSKAITSYSLNGIAGVISEATTPKTISVVMPFGTNLATAMTATYLTTGTSVTVGGVVQNSALPPTNVFTSGTPKVYTVVANDGSTATYNVNVTVATSSAKAITSYSLDGIAGVISEATTPKTISVVMPFGTNLATAMTATYLTTGTSVTVGGVVQNSALPPTNVFTSGTSKVYTVIANDASTATYNVNVTVATSSAKAITSYSLDGIAGVISEATTPKTIAVIMPSGTDLTLPMTATWLTTGTSVTVGTPAVTQVSALPPTNVFTSGTPKVYTVMANDGTTASYNVNVTVATNNAKAITSYSLNGIAGVISEATTPKTITVVMPSGTDLTLPMTATWLTTGTSVLVGATQQISALPPTNVFTQGTPKVYTVTASDGSLPASYNVNVSVATGSAKAITSYSLNGIAGVISENTTPKTIAVIMPSGTDLTLPMTATWLTTGTSVMIGVTQQFSALPPTNVFTQGTPKVYSVTAADGSAAASYDVNVSVASSSAKAITSFSLDGIAGIISENTTPKTITVVMPKGTDLTLAKTATWLTTGTSVLIGATQQFSALPPTNVFTQGTPKVYSVTAADLSSPASYNVNVSVTPVDPGPAGAVPVLASASTFGMMARDAMTLTVGVPAPHIYGNIALTGPTSTSSSLVGFALAGTVGNKTSIYVTGSKALNVDSINTTDNGNSASLPQLLLDLQATYANNKLGSLTRVAPAAAPIAGSHGGTFGTGVVDLTGKLLLPGIYAVGTTTDTFALSNSSGHLVLDGEGNADAVFVFQADTMTTTTGSVVLQNGAQAKNVYWVMTNNATIGTNTFFQGTIVAGRTITVNANTIVQGRMLAGGDVAAPAGTGNITVSGVITVPPQ